MTAPLASSKEKRQLGRRVSRQFEITKYATEMLALWCKVPVSLRLVPSYLSLVPHWYVQRLHPMREKNDFMRTKTSTRMYA
jgi:hypothetical protein